MGEEDRATVGDKGPMASMSRARGDEIGTKLEKQQKSTVGT